MLKYSIVVGLFIKFQVFPVDFMIEKIVRSLAENQENINAMWYEMQEGKTEISRSDINAYLEKKHALKIGQINKIIVQVESFAKKNEVDPNIIKRVNNLAKMKSKEQQKLINELYTNKIPCAGIKGKTDKELSSFSEKERIRTEIKLRTASSQERKINRSKGLDGFSFERNIHRPFEDPISKETLSSIIELIDNKNFKDIPIDLINKYIRIARTSGIWSRRDFCYCSEEFCRKRHIGANWNPVLFGPSEDGVIDNICLTFNLYLPTFMCPKSKYGAVADIMKLPVEFYEERGCRAATESGFACNCKKGRHHNTNYMDILKCFKTVSKKEVESDDVINEQHNTLIKEIKVLMIEYAKAKSHHIETSKKHKVDSKGFIKSATRSEKEDALKNMYMARNLLNEKFDKAKSIIANTILKREDFRYICKRTTEGNIIFYSPEMIAEERKTKEHLERIKREQIAKKEKLEDEKRKEKIRRMNEKTEAERKSKEPELLRKKFINAIIEKANLRIEKKETEIKLEIEKKLWAGLKYSEAHVAPKPIKKKKEKKQREMLVESKNSRRSTRKAKDKKKKENKLDLTDIEDTSFENSLVYTHFDAFEATQELDLNTYTFDSKKAEGKTQIFICGFDSNEDAKDWFRKTTQLKNSCTSKKFIKGNIMFPPPKRENVRKRVNICCTIIEELVKTGLVTNRNQIQFSKEFTSSNKDAFTQIIKILNSHFDDEESDDDSGDEYLVSFGKR